MPPKIHDQISFDSPPATDAGKKTKTYLQKLNCDHKIAVGLSGGVDSSLAAALLIQAGWEVKGITLWLMSGKGSCCSEGLVDAAGLCKQIGIDHHIIDSRETFKKEIIETVVNDYKNGITPLPCSRCNRSVKFSTMLDWVTNNLKTSKIATGHYARIHKAKDRVSNIDLPGKSEGRNLLLRGVDKSKDQSYFLYDLPQSVLERVIFPLGELTKKETRIEANKLGLRTAEKSESQDLCLAEHHGSMHSFLDAYLPPKEGEIRLEDGTLLGKHDGIEHFTIGQRKGLGVSWTEPLHVIRLEASENRVIVAPRSKAGKSICNVNKVNWISIAPPEQPINIMVQVRYKSLPVQAKLIPIASEEKGFENNHLSTCRLEFKEEQFSITPGQAAVFYHGDVVLGGGLIGK